MSLDAAGVVTSLMEPGVDACQDFYQLACGGLLKNAQIPAGIRIPRGTVVAADATPEYFLRAATPPAPPARKRETAP